LRRVSGSIHCPQGIRQLLTRCLLLKNSRGVANSGGSAGRHWVLRKSSLRRLLLNQRADLSGSLVFADNSPLPTLARSTPLPLRSESLLWDRIGLDRRLRLVLPPPRLPPPHILQTLSPADHHSDLHAP